MEPATTATILRMAAAGIGALLGYFDDPARDAIERFGDLFPCRIEPWTGTQVCGLNAMHTAMIEACPGVTQDMIDAPGGAGAGCREADALWGEMSTQIGRRDVARAQDWMRRTVDYLTAAELRRNPPAPLGLGGQVNVAGVAVPAWWLWAAGAGVVLLIVLANRK